MKTIFLSLAFLLATGCPLPVPAPQPPEASSHLAAPPAEARPIEHSGLPVASRPELRISFRTRSTAAYDYGALGPVGRSMSVRVTNTSAHAATIGRLHVGFTTTRDGVSFPCTPNVDAAPGGREPSSLGPGESFVFERQIDCSMPLPGRYDVRVFVRFGDDYPGGALGDPIGSFTLELVAADSSGPKAIPSRPGLYALMTGRRDTPPLPAEAWARGDYRVVLAVINGSSRPIRVGPARLAFLVYKRGAALPCSGQAEPVAMPEDLASGAVHLVRAPIACAPSDEGRYEVVGRLTMNDAPDDVEVGRFPLKVTRDPLYYAPEMSPSWGDRPRGPWTR